MLKPPEFRTLAACASLVLAGFVVAPRATANPLTANGTQPPLVNALVAPDNCAACHGDYDPAHNIEPYPTWAGSMMAQSARDPVFWASLDVANHDIPTVGDLCLRCHAPRGWLAGRSEPPDGSEDGCGLVGKIDAKTGDDFSGVACEFCHRMKQNPNPPSGELSVYEENGQFWIDEDSCNGSPCRYGPYDYPKDGSESPVHAWAYSSYHESGQFCGNCHNVTHPAKNLVVGGTDTGKPFPIERTYREWQQSDYSSTPSSRFATCQNCHMPDSTVTDAKASGVSTNTHTGDLPIHEFAGGNSWVPEVLRLEYPGLDIDADLAATRDAAVRMLTHAAKLELTVAPDVDATKTLPIQVKVENLTGHKLPTGYPEGRRMWLSVSVRDQNGKVLLESGAYDAATGTLTEDANIKTYEAHVGIWNFNGDGKCDVVDSNGKPMFHFVLNDCVLSDNRIPPAGFVGGQDMETRPVGYTYPETSPGSGVLVNYDLTDYSVVVPAAVTSPLTVERRASLPDHEQGVCRVLARPGQRQWLPGGLHRTRCGNAHQVARRAALRHVAEARAQRSGRHGDCDGIGDRERRYGFGGSRGSSRSGRRSRCGRSCWSCWNDSNSRRWRRGSDGWRRRLRCGCGQWRSGWLERRSRNVRRQRRLRVPGCGRLRRLGGWPGAVGRARARSSQASIGGRRGVTRRTFPSSWPGEQLHVRSETARPGSITCRGARDGRPSACPTPSRTRPLSPPTRPSTAPSRAATATRWTSSGPARIRSRASTRAGLRFLGARWS